MPEARERTVIHGIGAGRVGDAGQRVLLPVEIARLQGRLEADEELEIGLQRVLLASAVVAIVGVLRHCRSSDLRQLRRIDCFLVRSKFTYPN